MTATAPSLEKMNDTVQHLRDMVSKMDSCSQSELNAYEDKIRNEFQVIEAMIAYVGRDIYAIAQARRMQLRAQYVSDAKKTVDYMKSTLSDDKEENGTRSDRDTGDGQGGADKPSGSKRKGNSKTRRSS